MGNGLIRTKKEYLKDEEYDTLLKAMTYLGFKTSNACCYEMISEGGLTVRHVCM